MLYHNTITELSLNTNISIILFAVILTFLFKFLYIKHLRTHREWQKWQQTYSHANPSNLRITYLSTTERRFKKTFKLYLQKDLTWNIIFSIFVTSINYLIKSSYNEKTILRRVPCFKSETKTCPSFPITNSNSSILTERDI